MVRGAFLSIVGAGCVLILSVLAVPPQPLAAAPAPPELVVNHETRECAESFGGDECMSCFPPEGWDNLGYLGEAECPAGYAFLENLEHECRAHKNEFCCSEGHSGAHGDCDDLVIHAKKKQCAFVDDIASAALPKDWQQRPGRMDAYEWYCPFDYEWVADLDAAPEPTEVGAPTPAAGNGDKGSGSGGLPCLGGALIGPLAIGALITRRLKH